MIRAILWKEYREHRAVWLMLALVAAAALYGLSRLMAPDGIAPDSFAHDSLKGVTVLFAWTYGIVCGAMLLAIERESGTLTFLDILPVRRLELWLLKMLIGLVLFLTQVGVLLALAIGLNISTGVWDLAEIVMAMVGLGLFGMAWGLLFSARGESVLNVIGLAIAGQFLSLFAVGIVAVPVVGLLTHNRSGDPLLAAAFVCLLALALVIGPAIVSARTFSRPDRLRGRAVQRPRERADTGLSRSWGRLLWLTYIQMRRLLIGLTIFSLAVGFLVPVVGPVAWPFLTLLIGTLCGVTVCADEQMHGSFRFLGDQRFPLGRVWLVKLGMRFALAFFAAFLLLLPSLILTLAHRAESHRVIEEQKPFFGEVLHSCLVGPVIPTSLHLTMWLVYGFAAGQLGGLLFRKSFVAAVVSLGVATTLASFWVPSLLGIGLHFWQVMGVPVILLIAGWLLVPAWAADRLLARTTFVSVGASLASVGLWIAGGLWYRVAEVPDVPDQFDIPAFVASIPPLDNDKAREKIRGAWSQVDQVVKAFWNRRPGELRRMIPQQGNPAPGQPGGVPTFAAQIMEAVERGWSAEYAGLGDWMDREAFQGEWYQKLAEAADQPLGVVEDPKLLTLRDAFQDKWGSAGLLSELLAVRGLQLQARGDPGAFVDNLRISLALARTLQHAAPFFITRSGRAAEMVWPTVLDHWLEKLRGDPELLQRALAILLQHEAELPDEGDSVKAEYLIDMNTLEERPEEIILMDIPPDPENRQMSEAEVNLAALLWRIPWEQERHRRILRVVFQGDDRERAHVEAWGGRGFRSFSVQRHLRPRAKREIAQLRAAHLKVALRLYQAETGQPAETLSVLVPRYLPSIPLDPFSNSPFHYRLSRGERIGWFGHREMMGEEDIKAAQEEAQPLQEPLVPGMVGGWGLPAGVPQPKFTFPHIVPKGQGILWSVGEDGQDNKGVKQGTLENNTQFGEDIIYLVPLPAK